MTDLEQEDPIRPAKARKSKPVVSDRMLGIAGGVLAASAAFFPWYVFFNEDQFTANLRALVSGQGIASWTGRPLETPPETASSGKAEDSVKPETPDDIKTATVPNAKQDPDEDPASADAQPFPASPVDFHLLHVANGRAMIEDKTGIYVVEVGSSLPDLSKVASVEERSGRWVIITDRGEIYGSNGKEQ